MMCAAKRDGKADDVRGQARQQANEVCVKEERGKRSGEARDQHGQRSG